MKSKKFNNKKPFLPPKTRKESRKEKRIQQKLKKKNHFERLRKSQKNKLDTDSKVKDVLDSEEEILSEDDENVSALKCQKKKNSKLVDKKQDAKFQSTTEMLYEKEQQNHQKLQKEMKKNRIKQMKLANEEDEKVIKSLEKKLGIDKSKSKTSIPKIFNDGLDYALELCLPEKMENIYATAKKRKLISYSDDESNDTMFKPKKKTIEESDDHESDAFSFDEHDLEDSEDDLTANDSNSDNDSIQDESMSNNDENDVMDMEATDKKKDEHISETPVICTDIYGRTLDKSGNVVKENKEKYIPPHLKNKISEENEKVVRLKRQLKGNINRLAESNLPKIAKDIDNLYMQNSRNDMNFTITSLIFDALVTNILANERAVLEHVLLISVLHANVGSEVGANFLETLAKKFDFNIKMLEKDDVENKVLDNLIQIFCHLYTFKVIHQNLIYEILDTLIGNMNEKSVECILIVLRIIGFVLRKEDPIALKDLIIKIQNRVNSTINSIADNSRLKYMLDILLAIKNNNMKKIPQYDPTLAEHLKKQLKVLCLNGKYVTTLNISLVDLLKSDEHGKWWIVGSAWTGSETMKQTEKKSNEDSKENESFSEQLLELAKVQRMNTDQKKIIFCTIMRSEDFIDAFENLLRLNIKDNNLLISIIIHCCISEKLYNPYYAILTQKFCEYNRKYQLSTKFACWDKIHNLDNFTAIQIENFAKYLTHLIQQGGLAISVLKVIEFSELNKQSLQLMKKIMIGLLLSDDEQFLLIFQRIMPSNQLNSFKDSIRLFMQHFLKKKQKSLGLEDDQLILLNRRINSADDILARTRVE